MKTVLQQTQVEYHTINIQDAILILPIMDELVEKLKEAEIAFYTHSENEEKQMKYRDAYIKVVNQLNLMFSLGFRSSYDYQVDENIYYTRIETPSITELE